jgi:hypothetical protein
MFQQQEVSSSFSSCDRRAVNFTRKFLKRCATQQIEDFVTVVYFFLEGNFEMT